MAALPQNTLIIGGGIGGMSAAIRLMEEGSQVTLIDRDPDWSVYGSGVTCSGVTTRAMFDLGIGDAVFDQGATNDVLEMYSLANGALIQSMPMPPLSGPDRPAAGGVMRPDLHVILSTKVKEAGAEVRLGVTVDEIAQDADGVDVTFSDGATGRYDFVIGADGIGSKTRQQIFPDLTPPRYTGQSSWRVMFDQPEDWRDKGIMYMSPTVKIGFSPCAPGRMYMYVLEHLPDNPWREPHELPALIKAHLTPHGGRVADFAELIDDQTPITYRPLETVMIDGDWYKGRVLLIGDAAHATTPHLASGAGIAIEDALVLVEELRKADSLPNALSTFMERRLERAKDVVESSLAIGEMEMAAAPMPEQASAIQGALMRVAAPY